MPRALCCTVFCACFLALICQSQAAEGLNASGADGRKLRVPPAPSAKSQPLEPPVVTAVYTSDDLTEALKSGMEHIEIHNHLDLTGWSWGDEDREFDDNYVDGNCLEPFPSAAEDGTDFTPPLPEQKPGQCLIFFGIYDGVGVVYADVRVNGPGYEYDYDDGFPDSDEHASYDSFLDRMSRALWIDNILLRSVNDDIERGMYILRETIMTNVTLSGYGELSKAAVEMIRPVHMEDSVIENWREISGHQYEGVAQAKAPLSMKKCTVVSNTVTKGGVVTSYYGALDSPVKIDTCTFKNNADELLFDDEPDCCANEKAFFVGNVDWDGKGHVYVAYDPYAPSASAPASAPAGDYADYAAGDYADYAAGDYADYEAPRYPADLEDAPFFFTLMSTKSVANVMRDVQSARREAVNGTFLFEGKQDPASTTEEDDRSSEESNCGDDCSEPAIAVSTIVGIGCGAAVVVVAALVACFMCRRKRKNQSTEQVAPTVEPEDLHATPDTKSAIGEAQYPQYSASKRDRHLAWVPSMNAEKMSAAEDNASFKHTRHMSNAPDAAASVNTAHSVDRTEVEGNKMQRLPLDTMDSASMCATFISEKPEGNASRDDWKEYLESQLDSVIGRDVGDSLTLLAGRKNRLHGGQAVVQVAEERRSTDQYAIKFFLSATAFQQEKNLYLDESAPLGKFLPKLHSIREAEDRFKDSRGDNMPPCIVVEKGESLEHWIEVACGSKLDTFTGLQVLTHIADRLKSLHDCGYVHRDLKPGNVLWLPRNKRWTLIDFGCAARTGEFAETGFSLFYAAPEVLQAYKMKQKGVIATESLDCWSFGILAIEMLTGSTPFDLFQDQSVTTAMILGDIEAPWEDKRTAPAMFKSLGNLKQPIMGLLDRDPNERSTVSDFLRACRRMVSNTTIGR